VRTVRVVAGIVVAGVAIGVPIGLLIERFLGKPIVARIGRA
jgi:hypothetical protein